MTDKFDPEMVEIRVGGLALPYVPHPRLPRPSLEAVKMVFDGTNRFVVTEDYRNLTAYRGPPADSTATLGGRPVIEVSSSTAYALMLVNNQELDPWHDWLVPS